MKEKEWGRRRRRIKKINKTDDSFLASDLECQVRESGVSSVCVREEGSRGVEPYKPTLVIRPVAAVFF